MAMIVFEGQVYSVSNEDSFRHNIRNDTRLLLSMVIETELFICMLENMNLPVVSGMMDGRKMLLSVLQEVVSAVEYIQLLKVLEHIR